MSDSPPESLDHRVFTNQTLRASRFIGCDLAGVSIRGSEVAGMERKNPHAPDHAETVLSCLHTILEEEWEHHRYAVRDLDALKAADAGSS